MHGPCISGPKPKQTSSSSLLTWIRQSGRLTYPASPYPSPRCRNEALNARVGGFLPQEQVGAMRWVALNSSVCPIVSQYA